MGPRLEQAAGANDRARLGEGPLTRLNETELAALNQALRGVMGLD